MHSCTYPVAPLNWPKDLKTVPTPNNHHSLTVCYCLSLLLHSICHSLCIYTDCSDFLIARTWNECNTNNFFSISVTVSSLLDYMTSVITFCSLHLFAQMSRQDVLLQVWEIFMRNWSFIPILFNSETDNFQYKVLSMVSFMAVKLLKKLTNLLDIQQSYGKNDFTHVQCYIFNFTVKVWNSRHLTTLKNILLLSLPLSTLLEMEKSGFWDYLFLFLFQVKCKGLKNPWRKHETLYYLHE